jgi:hypothetical protein
MISFIAKEYYKFIINRKVKKLFKLTGIWKINEARMPKNKKPLLDLNFIPFDPT